MKEETRYKAVVKDKAHQEWTFVVGGCKMRETLEACARREFKEETGGVFEPIFPGKPTFDFTSLQRSKLELVADRRHHEIYSLYSCSWFVKRKIGRKASLVFTGPPR